MAFNPACFAGKKVIVTGGSRGIGRALCIKLAGELKAVVYAVSKNQGKLNELKAESPSIQTVAVDLKDWRAAREAVDSIGPVDYLVNNAGVYRINSFLDTTEEDFDECTTVNVKTVLNVSQVVAKNMIKANKEGSIVNVSSQSGMRAHEFASAYSLSKASLDHLTKLMTISLGPHGIRVNSVNPAGVATDMLQQSIAYMSENPGIVDTFAKVAQRVPLAGFQVVPIEQVVSTILFCLSDSASAMTGTFIPLDGGYSTT